MDEEKLKRSTTTDGRPPAPGLEAAGAPKPIDPRTGMHEAYWVLSPEERAKGFVRPVRRTYVHKGRAVCGKLKTFTGTQPDHLYVCVCLRGHDGDCTVWMPATEQQMERLLKTGLLYGCDHETTMGVSIAETYAAEPTYYGSTFCVHCGTHRPVGQHGEFVWAGTEERVGT